MDGEVDLPCDPLEAVDEGSSMSLMTDAHDHHFRGKYKVSVTLDDEVELTEESDESGPFTLLFNGYTNDDDMGGAPAPTAATAN